MIVRKHYTEREHVFASDKFRSERDARNQRDAFAREMRFEGIEVRCFTVETKLGVKEYKAIVAERDFK